MKAVREWLKQADPIAREGPLTEEVTREMRRVVLATVEERPPLLTWRHSVLAAATVAVAVTAAVSVDRLWKAEKETDGGPGNPTERPVRPEPASVKQLQFATPGGTRVIWVFNPDFKP